MMNRSDIGRACAATLILAAALAAPSPAAAQGAWELLGQRTVSDEAERDVIALPGNRRYSEIRICALRRGVRIRDVDVVFGNRQRQDIAVRRRLEARDCTRAQRLRGRGPRDIRRIVLRYEALNDRGPQPVIQVFGR